MTCSCCIQHAIESHTMLLSNCVKWLTGAYFVTVHVGSIVLIYVTYLTTLTIPV